MKKHPFSLAFLTAADTTPLEAVKIAAETGYSMIGFRLLPAAPTESNYPLMTDNAVLKDVKAALDDTGVQVADVEIVRLNETTDVTTFLPFLERARELGAKNILVAGDDPDTNRLTDTYQKFCELSAPFNLTADLEFMPWTKVPNLKVTQEILTDTPAPNAGILIDALHFDRCNTTLDDLSTIDPSLIHYVQLCDGPVPFDPSDEGLIEIARAKRDLPGLGGIDLVSLVKIMPDGVPFSIEIADKYNRISADPKQRAQMAIDCAKDILTKAGRSWIEK